MSPHCILWYGMVLYFIWSYCTVSHCYVPLLQRAGKLPRSASSHFELNDNKKDKTLLCDMWCHRKTVETKCAPRTNLKQIFNSTWLDLALQNCWQLSIRSVKHFWTWALTECENLQTRLNQKYHLWIVQKYACLDLGEEEVVAELDLLEAGGLLQLGRERSHLSVQHICHQIILQTINQKSHVSSSLVLCLDTASLGEQIWIQIHVL